MKSARAKTARTLPLSIAFGACVAVAAGFGATSHADGKYMHVEDIKPGMKGYGLTVMSGTKPERFGVEVVSTLHNFRPNQNLVLIKTSHPRLEVAHTVAGMSGSPIYLEGKMIGAYAYGWMFGVEPIAGVTPIKNMLADLALPLPKALRPTANRSPLPGMRRGKTQNFGGKKGARLERHERRRRASLQRARKNRFEGDLMKYDVHSHVKKVGTQAMLGQSAPQGTGLKRASTMMMVSGLGSKSFSLAQDLLSPMGLDLVQGGGGGGSKLTGPGADNFVDGSAISVQLVSGDVSIDGLGTVTHVKGNKLVAFGHPMLNGGIVNLPTATAQVHWILASVSRSFKIGEAVKPLGALVNDRQASIVVDSSRKAPTFPIDVHIEGAWGSTKKDWSMKIAHDQFFAPIFTALAIGNTLETASSERNDLTWRAKSVLSVEGFDDLVLNDFGAGNRSPLGPGDVIRSRLARAIGALLNNPWETATVKGVKMSFDISHERDVMLLRGAELVDTEIEPGMPAQIRLTLQPYLGVRRFRTIEVPLPKSFAGRTVSIGIMPGYMAQRVVPQPENLTDLVYALRNIDFPGEALVASYMIPSATIATFEGKTARNLPAHAVDALAARSKPISPRMRSQMKQLILPNKGFIAGSASVSVKIRDNR